MNIPVSALFVAKNSIYKSLLVDCWDEVRNANLYQGPNTVICHPPCRLFSRLRKFSTAPISEKNCAYNSVDFVRKYGGVLEHPASSTLWSEMNLPLGNNIDDYGGFTLSINQSWFGHKCEKKTWLYICGCLPTEIPNYTICFDLIEHCISSSRRIKGRARLKEVTDYQRIATPLVFAEWLINLCLIINQKKNGS